MPVIKGVVNGRIFTERRRCIKVGGARGWIPFDEWERELCASWKEGGIGDDIIAFRLMRPVTQVMEFDPVRPNGRRR